ncbi:MAG TPA: hypothetical protein VEI97_06195 [bacterium]|nr:hypothetical protein [bacterium]
MVQLSALAGEATEELQTSSLALGFVPPMDRSLPPQKQRRPPYAQLPVKDEPLFAVPLETGTKILVRGTITQIEAPRGDRAGFKVALIDWRLSLHQPGSTVEVLPFAKPK